MPLECAWITEAAALKEDGIIAALYDSLDNVPEQRLRAWRIYAQERGRAYRAEQGDTSQPTQDLLAAELASTEEEAASLQATQSAWV